VQKQEGWRARDLGASSKFFPFEGALEGSDPLFAWRKAQALRASAKHLPLDGALAGTWFAFRLAKSLEWRG
jgi:hypothetical protein